ncbi:MAG TPA: hypothetical protein VF167_17120 [Longimicrobiaceae bacterium]
MGTIAECAKVALIGGGVYVARLCELLAATSPLPNLHLSLVARRANRLRVIAEHAKRRVRLHRTDWQLTAHVDIESAVAGASLVVLLIRVGGLRARLYDETFPERFGLVGDEGLGAGGMANAWRTLPVLTAIADTLRRVAPKAPVVNLVAPLGITTRLLLDEGLRAFGICELPHTTQQRLLSARGDHRGARLHYVGLNHLGWFWGANAAGEVALHEAVRFGLVEQRVLREFGAAPLHYYYRIYDPPAALRLGVNAPRGRARWLISLDHHIYRRIRCEPGGDVPEYGERPTPWFEHAIIPVMTALLSGGTHVGFADFVVEPQMTWAPRGVVVEVPAAIASGTAVADSLPHPPPRVVDFLSRVAEAEDLTYRAAINRDRRRMKAAARLLARRLEPPLLDELTNAICGGVSPYVAEPLPSDNIAL